MNFKMDHIVINAVDIEKSLDFYMNILDLPGERIEEFKSSQVPFPSVRITDDTIIDLDCSCNASISEKNFTLTGVDAYVYRLPGLGRNVTDKVCRTFISI